MTEKNKQLISTKSIFGEYKQDENRVTAALLHILHMGGEPIIQRIFGDVLDLPANDIKVLTQSSKEESVPDGEICCDCRYQIFIESKIMINAINQDQLNKHNKLNNPAANQYLCYITPDANIPQVLSDLSIAWLSWEWVAKVLLGVIADGIASAVLKYLIEQFCILVKHLVYKDKTSPIDVISPDVIFTDENERVIIVGGSWGEDVAVKYGFYACQEKRSFLPAKYLAFCFDNRIKYLFEIISINESVDIKSAGVPPAYFVAKEPMYKSELRKLFTLKLVKVFTPTINNDKKDKNGNRCAFVYGQTYTTYNKIMHAKNTTDLLNTI